ncbi:hypothetical protein VPH35_138072 [Triticum aestivum]|uniref:RING-type domain-containing protein n=1 Tax=Aegilops tauschii TaxID=37682 RepID=M8BLD3_AEGTA
MVPPSTGSIDFAPPLPLPWDDYDPPGYESPPIRPWYPPPPPSSDSDSGWVLAVLLVFVFVVCMIGVVLKVYRSKKAHTEAAAEAVAAAAARARELPHPRSLPGLESLWQRDEVRLPRTRATNPGVRATNPTARLPAFKYNRSMKHNVMGGEEAATCSVCLGVFQLGETKNCRTVGKNNLGFFLHMSNLDYDLIYRMLCKQSRGAWVEVRTE